MRWFAGFVLGALGGWALGSLAGPRGGGRLGALAGRLGSLGAEQTNGQVGGAVARGRRPGRGRAGGMLLDERLTRRAWERLAERGFLNPRVDITTVDGTMYLRGRPRDAEEAALVLEIAETTPGVERVVNELKPLEQPEEKPATGGPAAAPGATPAG